MPDNTSTPNRGQVHPFTQAMAVFFVGDEILGQWEMVTCSEFHQAVATYRADQSVDGHWTHVFYHST